MAATILVCDNEEPLRALIRATVDHEGYTIIEAGPAQLAALVEDVLRGRP